MTRHHRLPRGLVVTGVATPGVAVSHELPLDRAPEGYRNSEDRVDGRTEAPPEPALTARDRCDEGDP